MKEGESECTQEGVREEWDNAVEAWVKFVREGKDYYGDGLNNPAAFKLIGNVNYHVNWNMKRLSKPFLTSSFHRTLPDYFNAIHKNKLFVSRLVEPRPTLKKVQKHPQLKEALTRPQSIIVECTKIAVK